MFDEMPTQVDIVLIIQNVNNIKRTQQFSDSHSSVDHLRRCQKDDLSQPQSNTLEDVIVANEKPIDFTKLDNNLLPTLMIIGHSNGGKFALCNHFIQRKEVLVYNTPDDHVTRDIREDLAKLADLQFKVLDFVGLET
ncbi:hypothetical protein V6N11_044488 [Hibiscus sabdariffa]|uniref:G domain-containing protein n=1 Tax=Hibiscus sabdariffa TaxID=183260 RepID=A0ABR2RFH9_9ROSI